ncbi:sigma 54-interacting transcriptional regulator [Alkaliphilus serpentinus]|uniref:HTH-type transcriptional regulatory protein TyrR n=1 Tax=Alkaliphilus serpentinus TaxID=1482731 RepID=A0A833M9S8_9FIRM|nr:sigma 54-interacting transcriptional regulator [Alkaliphilus serpentinus]KAB3530700.1 PAS domain S-box protein [Alkaliphilus serpentinus]
MKEIIKVIKNKCKQCYSCVRNCPAKAIKIENGQATVIYSRCINCGMCIKACSQNAKVVIDSKEKTLEILKNHQEVVACLAPSFVASFHQYPYKKVIGALRSIGFSQIWEVAVGAEELTRQLDEFFQKKHQKKTYISSPCPAFVTMIEKHHPELIKYLLPFASPMIATAKIIKDIYKERDIKIVFIGPCVAKKSEAEDPQFEGVIDSVLTFEEIKEILKEKRVSIHKSKEGNFDSLYCDRGRLYPLSGGLLANLKAVKNFKDNQYECIENVSDCANLIHALSTDKVSGKLIDVLMCKGCIEGPKIDSKLNYYDKLNKIYEFFETNKVGEREKVYYHVDLKRHYRNIKDILSDPSENEIEEVLRKTNKFTQEDELNCGACGYDTCREKAVAVVQEIAEVDMCLPYLLSKKTKLLDELSERIKEVTILKEELETVIESSYDGLVVTDGEGKILKTNKAWSKLSGILEDSIDKSVHEIQDKYLMFPSATLMALKEKRRISFMQETRSGKEFLVTATPIFEEDGKVSRVVSNARDIEELNRLKRQIEEAQRLQKYHKNFDNNIIDKVNIESENIVANSFEFGEILQTASNIAGVDSTVLVLGESGVGKEIVAKFIHTLSKRKDHSLIKINCGAIPENLIESEFFGYETGAFTGARSKGKPGLIELAHRGTLFLDEIGELPLNLQVKLLRVIQDRKIMRIGGTEEVDVDIRLITATNRNLQKMVLEGKFRADLFYRLNVVPIEIPPLRHRRADILPLCYYFIDIYNKRYGCNKEITFNAESALLDYSWPGNVRELENLIERLVVTVNKDIIDVDDLPSFIFQKDENMSKKIEVDGILPLKEAVELLEEKLIYRAHKKYSTTYEMAKALGVNQSTIVRKIQKYLKEDAGEHY